MAAVVLYLHVHQPFRIKNYSLFNIGDDPTYFDTDELRLNNQKILNKVAHKSYLPFNDLLLKIINEHPDFKVSFSISGVALDQFETYMPEVLESFQKLVATGNVELINETYYHSLAFLYSRTEFDEQVLKHKQRIKELFDYDTQAFRNTELIYNNDVARAAYELGFKTVLAEGVDRYLGWRSPNFVYHPPELSEIKLMLKNYKLSDDIAFRFSNKGWEEYPLSAEKYAQWINQVNGNGHVVNLFMDYETFGEHQWADTGIFEFIEHLPRYIKAHPDNSFMSVSEASQAFEAADAVDMPDLTSWADSERDLSAWLSNPMQHSAAKTIFEMEDQVKQNPDESLVETWRRLTTSDHFYYMCTKWFSDGDVHKYFSPNETPYEAFVNYMNILQDLRQRVYTE